VIIRPATPADAASAAALLAETAGEKGLAAL
jgi:hypothetical protein